MAKYAVILVRLVEESTKKANKEIETEIFDELHESSPRIPWVEEVEKVTVSESS